MKQKINTNCLSGMKCPSCNSPGPFSMSVTTNAIVSDEGTEDLFGDVEYNSDHGVQCEECGHQGAYAEFDAEKHYVERGGNHCPYCNADEEDLITEEDIQANGPNAWREMACRKCGMMWQDLFKLTGLGNYPDMDLIQLYEETDG